MGTTAKTVNAGDPTFAAKLRVRLVSVIFLLKTQEQHIKHRHHSLLDLASNHLRRAPGRMDKDPRIRPKRALHSFQIVVFFAIGANLANMECRSAWELTAVISPTQMV